MFFSKSHFIREKILRYHSKKMTDISREDCIMKITNILSKKFASGFDIKYISKLFNTVLSMNGQKSIKDVLPIKNPSIISDYTHNLIAKGKFLKSRTEVILKIPKKKYQNEDLLREYYIGVSTINKLRYKIPNFVATLGIHSDKEKKNVILYEKIPGHTLQYLLANDKISFNQWLCIFTQILISLEIAQREFSFTHYDLHCENVIITRKKISYNVHIDYTSYYIHSTLIPTIIDFGTSCVSINNTYIGSEGYFEHGMYNFMISGHDMYKFMIYSAYAAKNIKIKDKIIDMFRFYKKDDPYSIYQARLEGIKKAINEFSKKISISKVASYTPNQLLQWIFTEYKQKNIEIRYTLPIYTNMICKHNIDINQIIKHINNMSTSYIMIKYISTLVKDNSIQDKDKKYILSHINNLEQIPIEIDKQRLNKVFSIKLPSQIEIDDIMKSVLETSITHINPEYKVKVMQKISIFDYIKDIEPYVEFYYIISFLRLEYIYSSWYNEFSSSDVYRSYKHNKENKQRVMRWSDTLSSTLF